MAVHDDPTPASAAFIQDTALRQDVVAVLAEEDQQALEIAANLEEDVRAVAWTLRELEDRFVVSVRPERICGTWQLYTLTPHGQRLWKAVESELEPGP